jgi:hypothetical protein
MFLSAVAMCKLGHPEGETAWMKGAEREGIIYMACSFSSFLSFSFFGACGHFLVAATCFFSPRRDGERDHSHIVCES